MIQPIHKKLSFVFILIFAGVVGFVIDAYALSSASQETVSAYRQFKETQSLSFLVPTVIEIPFDNDRLERFDFAVLDTTTDRFQPYFFKKETFTNEIPVSISSINIPRVNSSKMIDGNARSYTEFALPENTQGRAQIVVSSSRSITSSSLTMLLDNHVALPTSIDIRARVNGIDTIVVASRRMTQSTLAFPRTTSNLWTITLTYAQPLRIAEFKFQQENATKTSFRGLRFLAQPDHNYEVYFNADRYVSPAVGEAGNLADDREVVRIAQIPSQVNPAYRQADVDSDGIPDILDNCVSVANTNQIDVNGNKRGDVCDDFDRDGLINSLDNCPNDPNRGQSDVDADGIGDACDKEESRFTERYKWIPWVGIGFAAVTLIVLFALTARSMVRKSDDQPPAV